MNEQSNRAAIEKYLRALERNDFTDQDGLLTDDVVEDYPQSGERIRGKANRRAIFENYPGRKAAAASTNGGMGGKVLSISGGGDEYTVVGLVNYPNGETWHMVALLHFNAGKIDRIKSFFAAPFEAPAWRQPYVEREPVAARA